MVLGRVQGMLSLSRTCTPVFHLWTQIGLFAVESRLSTLHKISQEQGEETFCKNQILLVFFSSLMFKIFGERMNWWPAKNIELIEDCLSQERTTCGITEKNLQKIGTNRLKTIKPMPNLRHCTCTNKNVSKRRPSEV